MNMWCNFESRNFSVLKVTSPKMLGNCILQGKQYFWYCFIFTCTSRHTNEANLKLKWKSDAERKWKTDHTESCIEKCIDWFTLTFVVLKCIILHLFPSVDCFGNIKVHYRNKAHWPKLSWDITWCDVTMYIRFYIFKNLKYIFCIFSFQLSEGRQNNLKIS